MAITKDQLIERAENRSERPGDYWGNVASMVRGKPGIGITDRRYYSKREWNWLMGAKADLQQPWD